MMLARQFILSGILYFIVFQQAHADLLIVDAPENHVVNVNSSVTLRCGVIQHEALGTYIFWDECVSRGESCRRISNDDRLVYSPLGGDPDTEKRYSVREAGVGVYELTVSDVRVSDAGTYRCTPSNGHLYRQADIIVIESGPICEHNVTSDVMSGGDVIMITCQVVYDGRWAPEMTWFINNDVYSGDVTDESFMRDTTQTLRMRVTADNDGDVISTKIHFPPPNAYTSQEQNAGNTPTFNETFTFPQLRVKQPHVPGDQSGVHVTPAAMVQSTCGVYDMFLIVVPILLLASVVLNVLLVYYVRGGNLGNATNHVLYQITTIRHDPPLNPQVAMEPVYSDVTHGPSVTEGQSEPVYVDFTSQPTPTDPTRI